MLLASPAIVEDIRTFKLQKSGLVTLAFLYCDFRDDQKKKRPTRVALIDQVSDQGDLPLDAVLDKLPTHSTPRARQS
jgi:hypothetical protein